VVHFLCRLAIKVPATLQFGFLAGFPSIDAENSANYAVGQVEVYKPVAGMFVIRLNNFSDDVTSG
jgi:hypothetical protein